MPLIELFYFNHLYHFIVVNLCLLPFGHCCFT